MGLISSILAGLEGEGGKLLHLRDVINLLRKTDEPQKVVQALQAVNTLVEAAPDELGNYAGSTALALALHSMHLPAAGASWRSDLA